ncbi:conserved Plasmodium protein, unknown function [Plasmodium relictum]|uniref:Uncharacterized protein n=1 Tax=Plasmodium relictum TaxID=85471 RepID=A0A1J1H9M5_PLARL|nr:conserved Plasmodium protein, unknown function [Plasmodium relictum]CRH01645.1 conserved Plasmodium protein, unknown function [Plasmodium relictum]
MFIANYFDRRDKDNEKKSQTSENDEYKRSNIENLLKNNLILKKDKKNLGYNENGKEQIKEKLSNFLKKALKKKIKKENIGKDDDDKKEQKERDFYNETNLDRIYTKNKEESTMETFLKENKKLNYCAENILLLGSYLEFDKLKEVNIQDIYKLIDKYIFENELEINEIKVKLEVEVQRELKKEKDKLHHISNIKSKLADISIIEEENNANSIEYMMNEMKIIKKLIKQKDYLICVKNTLLKLENAKKCAINRKYEESLHIILDIVKLLHVFKKNFKEQIINGIKFFIPLLSEYYLNKAKLLLACIYWGNNISYVSTTALEELINDIDSDDENFRNIVTKDNINKKVIGETNNIVNADNSINTNDLSNNNKEINNKYINRKSFKEEIKDSIIFDNTYVSLIKKESSEFINILISWNLIEKIDNYLKNEKNTREEFSFSKKEYSISYTNELTSNIIYYFRSLFQNFKSPLFKFDKPEWGLKYLFYQSIISNSILKMLLHFAHKDLKNNILLQDALQGISLSSNKYKKNNNDNNFDCNNMNLQKNIDIQNFNSIDPREDNNMSTKSKIEEKVNKINGKEVMRKKENILNLENEYDKDSTKHYITYNNMNDDEKEKILYELTNYEVVLEKINYKIVSECRLYILSRISYLIHLYNFQNDKENTKKVFLNFMHHIIMIYKKWYLYDSVNCKYLLDDFFNNSFIEFLDTEKSSNKENSEYEDKNENILKEEKKNENSKLKSENFVEMKGVYIRDFFILIEKEFLVDILKNMSNDKCCIKLKNNIILEDSDCVNEYGHIFIELLKKISNRIICFKENEAFLEEYFNIVIKKLLIIVKDEFRYHWNNITDLIENCNITCLLYVSFTYINKFLSNFEYKCYIKEIVQSFSTLENKMFNNFLDAFNHFISIRIYNFFSTNNLFHEYILNNLFKIKKYMPDHIFFDFFNKVLYKLDQSVLTFLMNQNTSFLQNENFFNTFINNSLLLIQQIEDADFKNKIYSMPILQEIIKLMTDDIDNLKKKINEIKSKYADLKNKNNWLIQVTKLTNALLRDDSSDDFNSSQVNYEENEENKKYQISLKHIKFLLLRRPDIKTIVENSVVIQEFIEY